MLFLFSFIVINWVDFSWLFNYRFISRAIPEVVAPQKIDYSTKEKTIEIPKINIFAPIIFFQDPDEKEEVLNKALNQGTIHFPKSVLPGQPGQTIILGHSAPPNWPKIKYDWVFTEINNLNYGDEVFVYFNGKKYTYRVKKKIFLDKGAELPSEGSLINSGNVLVLISCWPPGINYKRIAVIAVS